MFRGLVAVLLTALAVGGGGACSGEERGAAIRPETACSDAATALCGKLRECASFLVALAFTDVAQCEARFKTSCASSFEAEGTSATPTRLSQCARDLKTTSCDDLLARALPETCRTAPGKLADGAVCGHDAQCVNRLCRIPKEATCGACSTPGAAGADCERSEDCEYGLDCVAGECIAKGKAGAACSAGAPCVGTLACNGGTCAAPLAAGAPCASPNGQNPCDPTNGLFCHPTTKTCTAIETAPAGGACGVVDERLVLCAAGGSCSASGVEPGTCRAPASDGAPCDDARGPTCLAPARCRNGVCTIIDPARCK